MTIAPPDRELVDHGSDEAPVALELPDHGTGARRARRAPTTRKPGLSTRQKLAFAVSVVFLAVAIPVLGWTGFQVLSDSTAGRLVDGNIAPDEPNYEAIVQPTPTALIVQRDGNRLAGLTLLALTGEQGGAVLFLPPSTTVGDAAAATLAETFAAGGAPAVQQAVAGLLGAGIAEVVELDAARWGALVAPVAPVVVDNPDDVVVDTSPREVAFEAGDVELAGADIARFLGTAGVGQSDLARLARHEAFWTAWFTAVAATSNPETAVPGEVESGIGRFVRDLAAGLASGQVEFATLPVAEVDADGAERFTVEADAIVGLMARLVPLPTGSVASPNAGARARVRVLLGSAGINLVDRAIRGLVPAGAQIAVIGNADTFRYEVTKIEYVDPTQRAAAERFRAALGVGEIAQVDGNDETIDVTVVLGRDYASQQSTDRSDSDGSTTDNNNTEEQPTG